MHKERIIAFTNYGDPNDSLFESASSILYQKPDDAAILAHYEAGKAARSYSLVYAPTVGVEIFDSTERRKPIYNDCYHSRTQYAVSLPHLLLVKVGTNAYYQMFRYWRRNPRARVVPSSPVESYNWDGARRRAWWSMQPRFEGEISMLNFLYELKDFKDIMKHAAKFDYRAISDNLRKLKSNFLRQKRKGLNGAPFDPSLPAANIRLVYEYAIKPTLSDVSTILNQLGIIVREAQQEFQLAGEESQKSHYSEEIIHTNSVVRKAASYGEGNLNSSRFTATLSYKYDYAMRSDIDAFMTYWGLSGTWEAFWNAIPFSFLADYFCKIGKAVHMMERDRNVSLTTDQYCESVLNDSSYGVFTFADSTVKEQAWVINGKYRNGPLATPVFISGLRSTIFHRVLTHPNKGTATPRFSVPTWGQKLNMLALARCFLS